MKKKILFFLIGPPRVPPNWFLWNGGGLCPVSKKPRASRSLERPLAAKGAGVGNWGRYSNPAFDALHPHPGRSRAPYRVFNIGNQDPVQLGEFIATIERAVGVEAVKVYKPMQPGDVVATHADVSALRDWTGVSPRTPLAVGIGRFTEWFKRYYRGA